MRPKGVVGLLVGFALTFSELSVALVYHCPQTSRAPKTQQPQRAVAGITRRAARGNKKVTWEVTVSCFDHASQSQVLDWLPLNFAAYSAHISEMYYARSVMTKLGMLIARRGSSKYFTIKINFIH